MELTPKDAAYLSMLADYSADLELDPLDAVALFGVMAALLCVRMIANGHLEEGEAQEAFRGSFHIGFTHGESLRNKLNTVLNHKPT